MLSSLDDFESAYDACPVNVGAAAEFLAECLVKIILFFCTDGDDADVLAVFFAEQRHCAELVGLVPRQDRAGNGQISGDFVSDKRFDLFYLLSVERLGIRKVKSQVIGANQTALLGD